MPKNRIEKIKRSLNAKKLHKIYVSMLALLMVAVVLCTDSALTLHATTMEYSCGMEEHTHTDECYTVDGESGEQILSCGMTEHTHSDECYTRSEEQEPEAESSDITDESSAVNDNDNNSDNNSDNDSDNEDDNNNEDNDDENDSDVSSDVTGPKNGDTNYDNLVNAVGETDGIDGTESNTKTFTCKNVTYLFNFTVTVTADEALPENLNCAVTKLETTDANYYDMVNVLNVSAVNEMYVYRLTWANGSEAYTLPESAQLTVTVAEADGTDTNGEWSISGFVITAETDDDGNTTYTGKWVGRNGSSLTFTPTAGQTLAIARTTGSGDYGDFRSPKKDDEQDIVESELKDVSLTKEWDLVEDEEHPDTVYANIYRVATSEIVWAYIGEDLKSGDGIQVDELVTEEYLKSGAGTVSSSGKASSATEVSLWDYLNSTMEALYNDGKLNEYQYTRYKNLLYNPDGDSSPVVTQISDVLVSDGDSYTAASYALDAAKLTGNDPTYIGDLPLVTGSGTKGLYSTYASKDTIVTVYVALNGHLKPVAYFAPVEIVRYRYYVAEVYSDYAQEDYTVTYEDSEGTMPLYSATVSGGRLYARVADPESENYYIDSSTNEKVYYYSDIGDAYCYIFDGYYQGVGSVTKVDRSTSKTSTTIELDSADLAEIDVDGNITITNADPGETASVTKEWVDSEDTHGDGVTVSLYRRTNRSLKILKTVQEWGEEELTSSNTVEVTADDFLALVNTYLNNPDNYKPQQDSYEDENGKPVYYYIYPPECVAYYIWNKYLYDWGIVGDGLTATLDEDTGEGCTLTDGSLSYTFSDLVSDEYSWDYGIEDETFADNEGFYDNSWNLYTVEITDTYEYYVAEDEVPDGYTVSYSDETRLELNAKTNQTGEGSEVRATIVTAAKVEENGTATITNTDASNTIDIEVTKDWLDAETTHPNVTVDLLRRAYVTLSVETGKADSSGNITWSGETLSAEDVETLYTNGNSIITNLFKSYLTATPVNDTYDEEELLSTNDKLSDVDSFGTQVWFSDELVSTKTITTADGEMTSSVDFGSLPLTATQRTGAITAADGTTITDSDGKCYRLVMNYEYEYWAGEDSVDGYTYEYTETGTEDFCIPYFCRTGGLDSTGNNSVAYATYNELGLTRVARIQANSSGSETIRACQVPDSGNLTITNQKYEHIVVEKEWDPDLTESGGENPKINIELYRRAYATVTFQRGVQGEDYDDVTWGDELTAEEVEAMRDSEDDDYYTYEQLVEILEGTTSNKTNLPLVGENYGTEVLYSDSQVGSWDLLQYAKWWGDGTKLPLDSVAPQAEKTTTSAVMIGTGEGEVVYRVVVRYRYEYYIREAYEDTTQNYENQYTTTYTNAVTGETLTPAAKYNSDITDPQAQMTNYGWMPDLLDENDMWSSTTYGWVYGNRYYRINEDTGKDIIAIPESGEIKIINILLDTGYGYELPQTGGVGTVPEYVFGGLLTAGSGAIAFKRSRRKRKK